jgi:hypothetical protein
MRTKGVLQVDNPNPYTDAVITYGPMVFQEFSGAPGGAVALSTDLASYQIAANKTVKVIAICDGIVFRTGQADDIQGRFGTSTLTAPNTDATPSGRPPFTGITGITPISSSTFRKKGFKPWGLSLACKIAANDLTTFNIKVIARQFLLAAAPTDVVLLDTLGFSKTKSTSIQIRSVASPFFTTQDYVITPDTYLQATLDIVTNAAGGSTCDLYSLTIYGNYNYL